MRANPLSGKPIKLRIMCEYFSETDVSTGKILADLTDALFEYGNVQSCLVISGRRPYRPQSRSLPSFEQKQGKWLTIYRLFQSDFRDKGTVGRLVDNLLFTLGSLISASVNREPNVNLVLTNPPFLPLATLALSRIKGTPYIYLIHDIYPDIAVASHILKAGSITDKLFRGLQRHMLNGAERVVVLGRCMAEEVQERYGVPEDKITVIPNWWSPVFRRRESHRPRVTETLRFTYAGNIGVAQDFESILDAAAEIEQNDQKILIELIGEGEKRNKIAEYLKEHPSLPVSLKPYLSEKELAHHFLNTTDVALVTLNPEVSGLAVPSKTYNILAAGLPILAIMDKRSEIGRMVEETGCGIVVSPGDREGLVQAIRQFKDPEFRQVAGQQAWIAANQYDLRKIAVDFTRVFEQVVNS